MISVIIPTYNHPKRLGKALQSLTKQTYSDFEIIIIDDGSKTDLQQILNKYQNKFDKLRQYRIDHGGANKARQYGYDLASGEYLIFWDHDVVGKPDMLESMLSALREHPRASYAYSSYNYGFKTFKIWPFDAKKLKRMPYIHTTSLIRNKHFPGFDPELKRLQDWDLWLTMLAQGYEGIYIPKNLFKIITGGSMSSWLPKIAYKKPYSNFLPKKYKAKVKQYEAAVSIIKKKHNLK